MAKEMFKIKYLVFFHITYHTYFLRSVITTYLLTIFQNGTYLLVYIHNKELLCFEHIYVGNLIKRVLC